MRMVGMALINSDRRTGRDVNERVSRPVSQINDGNFCDVCTRLSQINFISSIYLTLRHPAHKLIERRYFHSFPPTHFGHFVTIIRVSRKNHTIQLHTDNPLTPSQQLTLHLFPEHVSYKIQCQASPVHIFTTFSRVHSSLSLSQLKGLSTSSIHRLFQLNSVQRHVCPIPATRHAHRDVFPTVPHERKQSFTTLKVVQVVKKRIFCGS
jgi:hypothetical protein